jgi:flagellar hook-associated protein 1 FlgK
MSDLFALGAAGVRAFQAALTQVGDNVANADTPGYVRRTLRLATGSSGNGAPLAHDRSTGAGVIISEIARASDGLAVNAGRVAGGDHARLATRSDWLARLETLLTGSDLDSRLGSFFDAGTDLAAAPTSTAARTIFLDRTDQAASAFRNLGTGLDGIAADLTTATTAATRQINDLTAAIGRVNSELRRTTAGGTAANGLLDSRDRLLAELAAQVRITVTEGTRGEAIVRLGSGGAAALLVDATGSATRIGVKDGPSGAEIILDPTHAATAVQLPGSGALAGLIEAARKIAATRDDIDDLATRFGSDVNAWHRAGTDALGDAGGALLATRSVGIAAGRANAGSAAIDISIADDQLLAADGYRLLRDPGGWTLTRVDGTASVSGPGPLVLDGVTVRPGNGARDGDSWTLPIIAGAAGLALRPLPPARLAVADRFLTDSSAANTGSGKVTLLADPAAVAFAAPPPYQIIVNGTGVGDISDIATGTLLASVAFDGVPNAGLGFQFSLSGTPAIGDMFRILATGAGSNDNGNALKLDAVRRGGSQGSAFETSLDASIAGIGSSLAESRRLSDIALAVRDDAALAIDAVSGVDLDREAAELTRLQVAYRANAQVMAAARDLFDTMLGVAR